MRLPSNVSAFQHFYLLPSLLYTPLLSPRRIPYLLTRTLPISYVWPSIANNTPSPRGDLLQHSLAPSHLWLPATAPFSVQGSGTLLGVACIGEKENSGGGVVGYNDGEELLAQSRPYVAGLVGKFNLCSQLPCYQIIYLHISCFPADQAVKSLCDI